MATNRKASAISRIATAYDSRKLSERKLIFFAVPALILFIGAMTYIEPTVIEIGKIYDRIDSIEKQRATVEATKAELFSAAKMDPDADTKDEIQKIEKLLAALEREFETELGQLVSPQAMPILLEQFFERASSLKLLKMESIPPLQLYAEEDSDRKLYKHGIKVTFEGSYLDTRDFLAQAESLGWKLYWRYLQYEVSEHPNAKTELEVFTLSTSEAFIGVN